MSPVGVKEDIDEEEEEERLVLLWAEENEEGEEDHISIDCEVVVEIAEGRDEDDIKDLEKDGEERGDIHRQNRILESGEKGNSILSCRVELDLCFLSGQRS